MMNTLAIISSLLTVTLAQQQPFLNCSYFLDGGTYACELTINNADGLNNFTEIGGIHLDGYTNADTELLYRSGDSASTNVPSIICGTFPNLIRMQLYFIGLTEIDDTAFAGCSRLNELGLSSNRIRSVSASALVDLVRLTYINLNDNSLATLPENVFAMQQNLSTLDMSLNPFENIPVSLFRPLENLQILFLSYANLDAINNQWFTTNLRLNSLTMASNRISVSADSFVGLEGLRTLDLAYNTIDDIPSQAFAPLQNLQHLYLTGNNFTELQADSFPDLRSLETLDIRENPIAVVNNGAFRGLGNLNVLTMSNCRLQQLHSNSFEGLGNLTLLSLDFNRIEELPPSVFVPLPNLSYFGLWYNRLKTLRRNSFGSLSSLQILDLEGNVVNGLERAIIDDAVNLDSLFFNGNLCANNYFGNFPISRAQHLLALERCFSNMRYIIGKFINKFVDSNNFKDNFRLDTVTEGDDDFWFFPGPHPGIALRVRSENEVQVALTPFNFTWNPVIEIFIGTTNNSRSVIRINRETNVAVVPTPNIIARDQWNDFRITWANQVILVYSGNNNYPFMSYTMEDLFPVNFYGLRAV